MCHDGEKGLKNTQKYTPHPFFMTYNLPYFDWFYYTCEIYLNPELMDVNSSLTSFKGCSAGLNNPGRRILYKQGIRREHFTNGALL